MKTLKLITILLIGVVGKLSSQNAYITGPVFADPGGQEYYEAIFDYTPSPFSVITWSVTGGTITSQSVNPTQTVWCIIEWDNTPGTGLVTIYEDLYGQYDEKTVDIGCDDANAGSDVTICSGNSTSIGTSDIAGYIYSWSPATGLNNPDLAQPSASPSQTTTYTLSMFRTNLIYNGDFESGMTGFSSDYGTFPNGNGNCSSPGSFGSILVTTNPQSGKPEWCDYNDRTSGSGYMLTVDGECASSQRVWYQTVTLSPNTTYYFSGWASSNYLDGGSQSSMPKLRVTVNGTALLQNFYVSFSDCAGWQHLEGSWSSGSNTSAVIAIYDDNLVSAGNDFNLDDLYFGVCPVKTDQVTVTVHPSSPVVSPSGPITYYNQYESENDLVLSSSPASSYQWYKNNVAITGATNQTYTIEFVGLLSYTDYYKVITSCGTSNTVTFNYVGCDQDSDYPVTNTWTVCASNYPVTLYQPNLGSGTGYHWSTDYPNCYTLSNFSGNTCQADIVCAPYYMSAGIYTRALKTNGEEIRMYFGIYADPSCRTGNLKSILTPSLNSHIEIPTVIKLSPNPSNTYVNVSSSIEMDLIEILSVHGNILSRKKANKAKALLIDTKELNPGIYIVKVITRNNTYTQKLVVTR